MTLKEKNHSEVRENIPTPDGQKAKKFDSTPPPVDNCLKSQFYGDDNDDEQSLESQDKSAEASENKKPEVIKKNIKKDNSDTSVTISEMDIPSCEKVKES